MKPTSIQPAETGHSDPSDSATSRKVYQGVIQPRGFPGLPAGWTSEWETFAASDGKLQLFAVTHHSNRPGGYRALVVLHGLGEHGGRYLHFPHYVKDSVDQVYCLDNRGHGRSEGLRGHVDRFDLYAEDAALAIRRFDEALRKRYGKSEIHLQAHSMGGLIALRMLIAHSDLPIKSVNVSAPLLGVKVQVPAVKKIAAVALSKIWGSLHMTSELEAAQISHDKEVVDAYTADRLVHSKVTPKFFIEMQAAIADTVKRHDSLKYPLQVCVPMQDMIVDSEASLRYFRELKQREKQLRTYPTFFHEPFNEIGKEKAFEDLNSWIKTYSAQSNVN